MENMKKLWPLLRDYALITLGTLAQAVGLRLFMVPADLASGGVSGISQLINYLTQTPANPEGWPIGVMIFIGNVPLFLIGWRFLGGMRFAVRTAWAIATVSFFVEAVLWLPFFPRDGLTDDIVLNSLYGAVVTGVGFALVYRGQGTSGGSDILARILNFYRGVPMTQSYLITDTLVILTAGLVFGWKEALYAIITLYVSGLVVDTVIDGGGTVRTAFIVTSNGHAVAKNILDEMQRGVTILEGTGAYTGSARPVLYCVVTRGEIPVLKRIIHDADPQAFMVIGAAHEALGEGFKPLSRKPAGETGA